MIRSVIISILLLQLNVLMAQEVEVQENSIKDRIDHSLGIAGGTTSAYGLSYRFYYQPFGIQLTYAPFKDENTSESHLGICLLLNLIKGERATLFLYQSNYFFKRTETYDSYSWNTGKYEEMEDVTKYANHGIGLGIEFIIVKVVGFNVMGGYGSYKDGETIGITAEGGLYYKF